MTKAEQDAVAARIIYYDTEVGINHAGNLAIRRKGDEIWRWKEVEHSTAKETLAHGEYVIDDARADAAIEKLSPLMHRYFVRVLDVVAAGGY